VFGCVKWAAVRTKNAALSSCAGMYSRKSMGYRRRNSYQFVNMLQSGTRAEGGDAWRVSLEWCLH